MHIGCYLKEKRIEAGYTQEQIAELVGVDERTIRRIEKNEQPKANKTLKKICKILGIDIPSKESTSISQLTPNINQLNPSIFLKKLFKESPEEVLEELDKNLKDAFNFAMQGNYREALDIYLAFSKLFSKEFCLLGCATMYNMLEDYENAIKYSDKVISINPYNTDAINIKANSLGELKDFERAINLFNELLSIKVSFETHYNLGVSYQAIGDTLNAVKHYEKCLNINPNFDKAHLNIGICLFDTGFIEKSLHHFNESIKLNPNLYQAYARKGEYYRFYENYNKAIKYYTNCLNYDEYNYQSLIGIALTYAYQKNILESSNYFKLLLKNYAEHLFGTNPQMGKKVIIIDIGYKKMNVITLEFINSDRMDVYIQNKCIPINMKENNDFIFIGSILLTDETGSMPYSHVGKVFTEQDAFYEVIDNIKKSTSLFQFFDKQLFIDTNRKISVNIIEQEDNIHLEILFNNKYSIIGVTDTKVGGLEAFIKYYNEYEQFRILLQYKEETFTIQCFKTASIKLLNSFN